MSSVRRPFLFLITAALGVVVAGCSHSPTAPTAPTTSPSSPGSGRTSTPPGSASAPPTAGSSSAGAVTPPANVGPPGGPVPAGFVPASVTFTDANHGWVLGTAPCPAQPCTSILRTRDGGRTWQGIPAPKAVLAASQGYGAVGTVDGIRFADSENGWVYGRALWSTHDGGASWKQLSLPGLAVNSLGAARGEVYAGVAACPSTADCRPGTSQVYAAAVDSDTLAPISTLPPAANGAGLVVADAGWYVPADNVIYHGGGTSGASSISDPCPDGTASVAVADAQHLDAFCSGQGAGGSAEFQLYGTVDGGAHWAKAGAPSLQMSGLWGMADNTRGVLLAGFASGASVIKRSTDDGQSLPTVLTVGSGGLPWHDLGFTTPSQAVAVLYRRALYLSHDSGRSWVAVSFR